MKRNIPANCKKVFRYIFLIVFLYTMAFLAECVFFQFHALWIKEKPISVDLQSEYVKQSSSDKLVRLSGEETESIRINQENERLLAEYYGQEYVPSLEEGIVEIDGDLYREIRETVLLFQLKEPYYVRKFDLRMSLAQKSGYTLEMENGQKKKTCYCSIDPRIGAGITNVNAYGQRFKLTFLTEEEIYPWEMTLTMSNTFRPNMFRVFLLFVMLFLTVQSLFYGQWVAVRAQDFFAVSAFLLGGAMIWGVGTNQVGYDEYAHAKRAYDLSFGHTIETTEAAMQLKGNLLPFFYTPEERALVEAYEERNNDYSWADITTQSLMVRAENRVYYPNAVGFKLARLLGMDFASSVEMAKLGGLIAYIAVMYFAVACAKQYQLLVAAIGLLPNNLFMACSLTRDMVVTSFLLLGSVLLMNEFLEADRKLTWQRTLAILLCFVCGSVSKPIYIVMILLFVFLGKEKFEGIIPRIVFLAAVCALAGLMLYDIFHPTPVATTNHQLVSNLAFSGDKRSSGTSILGQIRYIMDNPVSYTGLLLGSMLQMAAESFTTDSFINYGYLGKAPVIFNWIAMALGVWLGVFRPKDEERRLLSKLHLAMTILMLFGLSAIVWTSMYVSYTAVGSSSIEGVQGRYFIPLFIPFFICFFTKNKKSRLDKERIGQITFLLMNYMNIYLLFTDVLYRMNV